METRRFVGHSGSAPGINANFRRFIDDKYTIIVLSNYDGAAGPVSFNIESILFNRDYDLPTQADADFLMGFTLQQQGKFKEALKVFEKNTTDVKPHMPSLYQSARTKIIGKFDQEKAIAELDRYIKLVDKNAQPSAAAAWWRKGVAFVQPGAKK